MLVPNAWRQVSEGGEGRGIVLTSTCQRSRHPFSSLHAADCMNAAWDPMDKVPPFFVVLSIKCIGALCYRVSTKGYKF